MLKALQEEANHLASTLQQEEGLAAVQSIRQLVQYVKEIQPSIAQSSIAMTEPLYKKIVEGISDVAQDVAKEKYTYALQYVERILIHDLALLERLLGGENPFEEEHWIGFYHPDWNPRQAENTKRTEALEQAARAEGFQTVYFSNDQIIGEEIVGTDLTGENSISIPIPKLNVLSAQGSRTYRNQTKKERHMRREIPVLQHVITDKLHLPLEIHGESELSGLFIPAVYIQSMDDVTNFFHNEEVGVLKFVKEERGEGVLFVEKEEDVFTVHYLDGPRQYTQGEFEHYITHEVIERSAILQKYVRTVTAQGEPYDIRIHPIKNKVGKWEILFSYVRIGSNKGILSNLAAGGKVVDTRQFLQHQFGEDAEEAYEFIMQTSIQVAKDVDRLYGYALDELGLDITIDNNYQLWMHEVNTGPWTGHYEKLRADVMMQYAKYLAVSGVMPHNRFQDRVGFRSEESELSYDSMEEGQSVIGLLTESLDEMARALALEAMNRGQYFFVFRPEDVDAEYPYVRGFRLEDGEWQSYIVPYPHFILDRLRKQEDPSYTYLYSQFEHIPMTYAFEQKRLEIEQLHRLLSQEDSLREFLYPTALPQSLNAAMRFIERTSHCYMHVLEELPYMIMIRRDGIEWNWYEKGHQVKCTDRELRERLKSYVAKSIFLQEASSSVARLRLHYVLQDEEWKRVVTYPVSVCQVEEWADDAPLEQYMELVLFANTNWATPQKTLDELHAKADEVMAKIGEALQIDLHHVQLDFNVSREGEIHFVHASMDEPTSMYVAQPLARAMMRYACEQLQQ